MEDILGLKTHYLGNNDFLNQFTSFINLFFVYQCTIWKKKEQVTQGGPFRQKKYFETLWKAARAKTIKSIEMQEDNCLKKY